MIDSGSLTVTGVDTTPDMRQAMVFFDSLSETARTALEERRAPDPGGGERADSSQAHAEALVHGGPRRRERRPRSKSCCAASTMTTTSNGLLLLDKPQGVTSHDAVDHVRRVLSERRVGHAGTLDPMATGLLVHRRRRLRPGSCASPRARPSATKASSRSACERTRSTPTARCSSAATCPHSALDAVNERATAMLGHPATDAADGLCDQGEGEAAARAGARRGRGRTRTSHHPHRRVPAGAAHRGRPGPSPSRVRPAPTCASCSATSPNASAPLAT